jgi:hypothetical protein
MAENPIKSAGAAAGSAAKEAATQPATSATGPAARAVGCCGRGGVPEEDRGMMPDSRRKCRDVACCLVFM